MNETQLDGSCCRSALNRHNDVSIIRNECRFVTHLHQFLRVWTIHTHTGTNSHRFLLESSEPVY